MVKINIPNSKIYSRNVCECAISFPKIQESKSDFQEGVMVPKSAIVEKVSSTGVYTVSSQNTAVLRWVKWEKLI
jgi:hypothetical protein